MTATNDEGETRRRVNVVVGAGGGIGAAFADAILKREPDGVLVGIGRRTPANWQDSRRRRFLEADITDEASVSRAAAEVGAAGTLTCVVVATGLLHADGIQPERALKMVDPDALARLFAVNATGPLIVAKHLLPLMPRRAPSLFAVLSARVGSISDNRLGGWYGYRASKAALNMMIATLAVEHRRTHPQSVCVALHPGTVDTPLSAPFPPASSGGAKRLTPDQSAEALLSVMAGLTPEASGRFFAWDGTAIPW